MNELAGQGPDNDRTILPTEEAVDVMAELLRGIARRNPAELPNIDPKAVMTEVLEMIVSGHEAISGVRLDPFDTRLIQIAFDVVYTPPPKIPPKILAEDIDGELKKGVLDNHIAELLTGAPEGSFKNDPVALHEARQFRGRFANWYKSLMIEARGDTHVMSEEPHLLTTILPAAEPNQQLLIANEPTSLDQGFWETDANGQPILALPATEKVDVGASTQASNETPGTIDGDTRPLIEPIFVDKPIKALRSDGSSFIITPYMRETVAKFALAFRDRMHNGFLPEVTSTRLLGFPSGTMLLPSDRKRADLLVIRLYSKLLTKYPIFTSDKRTGYTLNAPFEVLDEIATSTAEQITLPATFTSTNELRTYLAQFGGTLQRADSATSLGIRIISSGEVVSIDSPDNPVPPPPSDGDTKEITVDKLDRHTIITVLTDMLDHQATIQDVDGTTLLFPVSEISMPDSHGVINVVLQKIGLTPTEIATILGMQPLIFERETRQTRDTLGQIFAKFEDGASDASKRGIALRLKKGLLRLIHDSEDIAITDIVSARVPDLLRQLTNPSDVKKKI